MAKYIVYVQSKPVEVSKEVYEYLTKSDNHIKYIEKTRKRKQVIIDNDNETITFNPSREDSLERMCESGQEICSPQEDLCEMITRKVFIEQAMSKLSDEERNLIVQLFYLGKTERELAAELNKSQVYVHKTKKKILGKLHKFLK